MQRFIRHPRLTYAALVVLAIVGLVVSGADGKAPKDGTPRKHDAGYAIAGVGFFAFLIALALLLAFSIVVVVRRRRRGRENIVAA